MEKPNRRRVSDVVTKMSKADAQLSEIINQTEQYKTVIRNVYQKLLQKSVQEALVNISVDELNRDKSGIRVASLKNAGYENVAQIIKATRQQLEAVSGISDDGAAKIKEKAEEICQNAAKITRVRLNAENKSPEMMELVTAIAVLMKSKELTKQAERFHTKYHANVVKNIARAKENKSLFKWIFAGKQKKTERVDALIYLENLLSQGVAKEAETLSAGFKDVVRQWYSKKCWEDFEKNAASYFAWLEQLTGAKDADAVTFNGLSEELVKSIDEYPLDTSLLKVVLRNYQVFGAKYILHQKRVLLGDEMGLGKTVQAIASMAHLKAQGKTHFVVVCPVSVMINWIREISEHSELTAIKVHGNTREEAFVRWQQEGGVIVTTYETISKVEMADALQMDMLIVDEAHYVKNPKAIRTKALMQFAEKAEYVLFMTGTPIENKVEEMIFLVSMLNENISSQMESLQELSQAPEFRESIAPVYLRRIREDVLKELPEKLEKEQWCEMTPAEEDAYKEALMSESYMKIRQVSWNVDNIEDSTKAKRLLEICEEAKADGRKILVFSFFLDTITKIKGLLGDRCFGPIDGSVSADERQEIIDRFSAAEAGSVLVCQIIAAGTGLNIQAASVVILCEPQWKPSTENQAISRAYRMGQVRNVVVHRLLSDETIDERMLEVLRGKSEIFNEFADDSVIDNAAKSMDEKKAMAAIVQSEKEKYGIEKAEETV